MSMPNQPAGTARPAGPRETGKQRASRIDLDYFKRGTFLDRWKNRLSLLVLLGALAYVGYALGAADGTPASRGPVASVHAAWDSNCQACHQDFAGVGLARLWGGPVEHTSSDARCQSCHSGYEHHRACRPEDVVGCGSCHRDHRGRDASLVRVADSQCTFCHQDLRSHVRADYQPTAGRTYADRVTSFADHPEIRPRQDLGNIEFDHKLHMALGRAPGSRPARTLGEVRQYDPAAYERYRAAQDNKADGAPVSSLTCASCHVLDPGDRAGSGTPPPPRPPGAYYQPISYADSCQACHPLAFDTAVKATVADAAGKPVQVLQQVPHRLQPAAVVSYLRGVYLNAYLGEAGNEAFRQDLEAWLRGQPNPTRPLPGKVARARETIESRVKAAQKSLGLSVSQVKNEALKGNCALCHTFNDTRTAVLPPDIPVVWQVHARFNHVAHRAVDCRSCHPNNYAFLPDGKDNPDASTRQSDVNLPEVKVCQQCHGPARREGGMLVGGVRSDCTECHSYHNGDHALQGRGARRLDPAALLTVEEFLRGATR